MEYLSPHMHEQHQGQIQKAAVLTLYRVESSFGLVAGMDGGSFLSSKTAREQGAEHWRGHREPLRVSGLPVSLGPGAPSAAGTSAPKRQQLTSQPRIPVHPSKSAAHLSASVRPNSQDRSRLGVLFFLLMGNSSILSSPSSDTYSYSSRTGWGLSSFRLCRAPNSPGPDCGLRALELGCR